jgi:hypothetical protein
MPFDQALILSYSFTPVEAAGFVAAALALLGFLILATLPLFGRKRRVQALGPMAAASEGMGMIDQSVGTAMQQVVR